jgi:hypothetical protein
MLLNVTGVHGKSVRKNKVMLFSDNINYILPDVQTESFHNVYGPRTAKF